MAQARHSITDWEKRQITNIHLLLEAADQGIKVLEDLEKDNSDTDWLTFRRVVMDLYSSLDYTYYLLHCHFATKGTPDRSSKNMLKCGFPYKAKGVKVSKTSAHDKSKDFVEEKLNFLFDKKIGPSSHFWEDIGKTLLEIQPKVEVDDSGQEIGENPYSNEQAKRFALLHFYRNCAAHRDLIHFVSKPTWVQVDVATQQKDLVTEKVESNNFVYYDLKQKAYWIEQPDHISGNNSKESYCLLKIVLRHLRQFTIEVCSRLLCSAHLLPFPSELIRHIPDGSVNPKYKPKNREQYVELTVTVKNITITQISSGHDNQLNALEDASLLALKELATKGLLPSAPFTYFVPHQVTSIPAPVQMTKREGTNWRQFFNEFDQRMKSNRITTQCLDDLKLVTDTSQTYQYSCRLKLKLSEQSDNNCFLVDLKSSVHEGTGKDKPREAALQEVMEECIHLGIVQLKLQ